MLPKSIVLDELTISLLKEVLINSGKKDPFNVKKFRVMHWENLDLLDTLEQSRYIEPVADVYQLRVDALYELQDYSEDADSVAKTCELAFEALKEEYIHDPDNHVSLFVLAKKLGIPRNKINRAVYFLIQAPGIISGRTTSLTQDDAYICPSEGILRHNSFEDAVTKLKAWRKPSPTDAIAPLEFSSVAKHFQDFTFLLHPQIIEHGWSKFNQGHLRNAVLDSMIAVFDLIREKTGINEDGSRLVTTAFSLEKPYLILSELDTESGKNDQKGFIQLLQGAYLGIRNPKAHTLQTDLTDAEAAQYLVFASLLIRRIEDAKTVNQN